MRIIGQLEVGPGALCCNDCTWKIPDRKARFAFIMPALSGDAAVRERWFLALSDVTNRRREPWVLDGLDYLHHPLRAAQSAK